MCNQRQKSRFVLKNSYLVNEVTFGQIIVKLGTLFDMPYQTCQQILTNLFEYVPTSRSGIQGRMEQLKTLTLTYMSNYVNLAVVNCICFLRYKVTSRTHIYRPLFNLTLIFFLNFRLLTDAAAWYYKISCISVRSSKPYMYIGIL